MATNLYYDIDDKKQKGRLDAIDERLYDDRLDEISIVKKEFLLPESHIAFFDNCDLHLGGQGFDASRAVLALQTEHKFFNGIMGLGGDVFDNANVVGKTNSYTSKVSPSDAIAGACKMFAPFKFAFVLGGNHSAVWGDRNKASNIGMDEELARVLNVDYARHVVALTLNILEPDTLKPKKMVVCLKHEVKNPQKFLDFLAQKRIYPDIIVREHTHDGNDGVYMTQIPIYENGLLKGYQNKQVLVLTGKTMQNANTMYGSEKSFFGKTNVKGILLSWAKNPYYNPKNVIEPKYTAKATVFNVLDKNKNEPSDFCQMVLRKYERPNIDSFKRQMNGKSLLKVASELEKQENKFKQNSVASKEQKVTKECASQQGECEDVR